MEKPEIVRIALIGSSFVGKTSMISRFINHDFSHIHNPTENITTFRKLIEINVDESHKRFVLLELDDLFPIDFPPLVDPKHQDSEICRIFNCIIENKRIFDKRTNEDELYQEHQINGLMFIFDLTNSKSISSLEKIMNFVSIKESERASLKNPRPFKKILVGNKSDLVNRKVSASDIEAIKRRYKTQFIKTSALCNEKIDDLFMSFILSILQESKDRRKIEISEPNSPDSEFGIETPGNTSLLEWCNCAKRPKQFPRLSDACLIM